MPIKAEFPIVKGGEDDIEFNKSCLLSGEKGTPRSVGSLPSKDGSYSLYCAVIVKKVDAQTRAKTSINELLRD